MNETNFVCKTCSKPINRVIHDQCVECYTDTKHANKQLTQILDMINKANEDCEKLSETYATDRISALVDDIEVFCKEHLKKEGN